MKNEVYLINGFAFQFAVRRKTKHGVGFCIHLHARGLVVMEGTMKHVVFIGLQSVMT
jgi:hypothetical protein